jgi:NAD(P)-dependent dehydrogenase (short-subunit alcohol dehydrogenase family)
MARGDPVVIAGATGMLGAATATELARRGIDTILVVRDKARGDRLVEALQRTGGSHRLVVSDLSEPGSVRVAGAAIRSRHPCVAGLVHAAAVLFQQRRTNSAGQEAMFATNVLARFLLTHELATPLAAASGRVVWATGATPDKLNFDDLMAAGTWNAFRQFRATNSASHQLALELARRGERAGISSNAYHPGALQSDLMGQMPLPVRLITRPFGRTAARAAAALADLLERGAPTGAYYKLHKLTKPPKASRDTTSQRRLWNQAATLLGLDPADTIGGARWAGTPSPPKH